MDNRNGSADGACEANGVLDERPIQLHDQCRWQHWGKSCFHVTSARCFGHDREEAFLGHDAFELR